MADTKHKEEILLVDLSHLQGNKVYLASFKEDGTHEVNALGLNPVAWVMVNRSGLAVCSVKKPPVWAVHSISATGETSEILKIDRSKLPRTVKGDLSPDGQKICFKVESHGQW